MKVLKQSGMGLIEVIVASAVGLMVVMGITSMINDVFKAQRSVQAKVMCF